MNYQDIAKMARHGVIQSDEAEYMIVFLNYTKIFSYSKWVLLRSTTIRKILSGHIKQTDSPIINTFTLSNNISRRSMEFITPPPPIKTDDEEDDDEDEDEEYDNEANVYDPDYHHNNNNNNHANYEEYEDENDDRYHLHSDDEDNYEYSHI